jgi:hypothetical protein
MSYKTKLQAHTSDYIHIPISWAKYTFLLACWAVSLFLMWNILSLAAANKAQLDDVNWFNFISCLAFAVAYYAAWGGSFAITTKLVPKDSPLLLLLMPLLLMPLLLMPLLLPLLPLLLLLLMLLLPLLPLLDKSV